MAFLSTVEEPQVPPTHATILSPLTLSVLPPPSPLPCKCTYAHAEQKVRECERTSRRPTRDLKAGASMTLHSNQSSFPTSDLRVGKGGAAIVAAPCNIQNQAKGEINDLSVSVAVPEAPGLIHKHKAHSQEERTPPPYVEPRCSVDLITRARCLQPSSPLLPSMKNKC